MLHVTRPFLINDGDGLVVSAPQKSVVYRPHHLVHELSKGIFVCILTCQRRHVLQMPLVPRPELAFAEERLVAAVWLLEQLLKSLKIKLVHLRKSTESSKLKKGFV